MGNRPGSTRLGRVVVPRVDNASVLEGWKAIAWFLGRSTRTVQRWERELGLPVRRGGKGRLQRVWASREALEAWMADQGPNLEAEAQAPSVPAVTRLVPRTSAPDASQEEKDASPTPTASSMWDAVRSWLSRFGQVFHRQSPGNPRRRILRWPTARQD